MSKSAARKTAKHVFRASSSLVCRASHTVYHLVIVLPHNDLWARPQSFIYQEKSSIYYWKNVAIVCENANRCGSHWGKVSAGVAMEAMKGSEVCAQDTCMWGSGRGSVSIWWMGMCMNSILYTNCSLTHSFLMTSHFWPGTPQVYKVKQNTQNVMKIIKCILFVQMPCVDKVMEPYNNKVMEPKWTTFFRENL